MTTNEIAWMNANTKVKELEEARRANLAKEDETKRSNLAKEAETKRANVAQEDLKAEANAISKYSAKTKAVNDATGNVVKGASEWMKGLFK